MVQLIVIKLKDGLHSAFFLTTVSSLSFSLFMKLNVEISHGPNSSNTQDSIWTLRFFIAHNTGQFEPKNVLGYSTYERFEQDH